MKSHSLTNPTLDELVLGVIGALARMGVEFRFNGYYENEKKREKENEIYYSEKMVSINSVSEIDSDFDISDDGHIVDEMVTQLDNKYGQAFAIANKRVQQILPMCHRTFTLIVKNGKERQKSICELAKIATQRRKLNTTVISKK